MTQNDAIQDGKRNIVAPMMGIMIVFLFIVMILLMATDLHIALILAVIPVALIPIFFFRIHHITAWKIRVYSELKGGEGFLEKAEYEWILVPWMDKYARITEDQKETLRELESVFSIPEPMVEVESLPELKFYFHGGITLIQGFFWAIGLGLSIMALITGIEEGIDGGSTGDFIYFTALGGFMTLGSLVYFLEKIKQYRQGKPAITLSKEGIGFKEDFHKWSSIRNIEITKTRENTYLEVTYKGKRFSESSISLSNIAVGKNELQNILDQYKQFLTP